MGFIVAAGSLHHSLQKLSNRNIGHSKTLLQPRHHELTNKPRKSTPQHTSIRKTSSGAGAHYSQKTFNTNNCRACSANDLTDILKISAVKLDQIALRCYEKDVRRDKRFRMLLVFRAENLGAEPHNVVYFNFTGRAWVTLRIFATTETTKLKTIIFFVRFRTRVLAR